MLSCTSLRILIVLDLTLFSLTFFGCEFCLSNECPFFHVWVLVLCSFIFIWESWLVCLPVNVKLFTEAHLHWWWVDVERAVRWSAPVTGLLYCECPHFCLGVNVHPGICPVSHPSVYTHCFSLGSEWHLSCLMPLFPSGSKYLSVLWCLTRRGKWVGTVDLLCNFCATLQPVML